MNKLEEYDERRLQNNPFAYSLKIKATKCTDWKKFTRSNVDEVAMPAEFKIERVQHAKLFYTTGMVGRLEQLTKNGTHLLIYILAHLRSGKDFVQVNHEHYMANYGVKSINTFKRSRMELIEQGFIMPAPPYKTVYWLNPNYLISGNRMDMYQDCVELGDKEFNL